MRICNDYIIRCIGKECEGIVGCNTIPNEKNIDFYDKKNSNKNIDNNSVK